jgi:transglutaminase-like putative cysteine protease
MTGTITPPSRPPAPHRPAPPAGAANRATAPRRRAPAGRWQEDRTLPATLALTLLTLAVAVGFARLFSDGEFLPPVVLAALAGHGVAWWCRRNELPTGMAAVATLGAVAVVASWTILGHTTAYGVPLPLTVRTALEVLSGARDQFATIRAPAPPLDGFVLATVLAIGITTFMADWAAFRLQATFEAIIPAFTLFLFTAALGAPRHRTWAVGLFVAGVLGFLVVHGLARSRRAGAWFGGRAAGGPASMLRTATVLGLVALLAGLAIGPRLPGPDGPIVRYKNRTGGTGSSSRNTVSPLVDIRGRLVDQTDVVMFTVKADQPSYWRLTSLDTFDGTIWSSNSTYRDVRGSIRSDEILQPSLDTVQLDQEFSISGLSSIWLPHAFRPTDADGVDVSYASDTSSLITPEDTTDGMTYTVQSQVPKMTPELLDQSPAQAPQDIIDQYLDLPGSVSDRVRAEAQRIVRGARTPYQRALALQNHFRTNYRYDIEARSGHDEQALENFLFSSRSGYCEQFAGAYAVLARTLGLPSRVAVGFTPGAFDEATGTYTVTGRQGHAWVEVYLHQYGWVEFDPTPGRGNPQTVSHTGLEPAQDLPPEAVPGAETTTTTAPGAETPTTDTTEPLFDDGGASAAPPAEDAGRPAIFRVLLAAAALALLWTALVTGLHLLRRARRWDDGDAAGGSRLQRLLAGAKGLSAPATRRQRGRHVLAAWADLEETFERAGARRRPAETMFEFSARVGPYAGLQPEPNAALKKVAQRAAVAAYSEDALAPDAVAATVADARLVRDAVLDQMTWWARLRWWVDPRPLLGDARAG